MKHSEKTSAQWNIAKSSQLLISSSANLDCANILIISKDFMKCLFEVWRERPKRASPVGARTMGLVRTCAHRWQISDTRVAKLKSHRHCGPGHEKIKLANPILASYSRHHAATPNRSEFNRKGWQLCLFCATIWKVIKSAANSWFHFVLLRFYDR